MRNKTCILLAVLYMGFIFYMFNQLAIISSVQSNNMVNVILKYVFIALLLAFLYVCSDEYHQTFVVGRTEQFDDVLIDFRGSIIGILIVSLIVKFNICN